MSGNITKTHSPQCEGETTPKFSAIGSIRLKCGVGTSAGVHRQGEKRMVRPSICHRELHLNKRICRPSSVKCSRRRSSDSFRSEPLAGHSSTRKRGLDLPQFLAQPGFDSIGRARLIRDAHHSFPIGKRSLTPPQLHAYGSRATTRSASTSLTP